MNVRDVIEEVILPQLRQPLWENWYIKDKIGSGAFSVVYRIEADRFDSVDVAALKIEAITTEGFVFSDSARKTSFLESQRRAAMNETKIMKALRDCPNVVRYEEEHMQELYIDGQHEGYFSLIRMEYLSNVFSMMSKGTFDYSERNVRRLAAEIGNGIKAAHDINVIHRDIKPDNMFMSDKGVYKLGDFNISKEASSARSFAGTNFYMAPEIFAAKSNAAASYTKQADIYSFGLSLYQMMNMGTLPFEETLAPTDAIDKRLSGAAIPPPKTASDRFAKIILKACQPDPAMRYQSIDEFLSDLENIDKAVSVSEPAAAPVIAASPAAPAGGVYLNDEDWNAASVHTRNEKKSNKPPIAALAAVSAVIVILAGTVIYKTKISDPDMVKNDSNAAGMSKDELLALNETTSPTESVTSAPETETAPAETEVQTETESPTETGTETGTETQTETSSTQSTTAQASSTRKAVPGTWSDWSEIPVQMSKDVEVESKVQYSFRTSRDETRYSDWSGWSDWQDGQVAASDTIEVEKRTLYSYEGYNIRVKDRQGVNNDYNCMDIRVAMCFSRNNYDDAISEQAQTVLAYIARNLECSFEDLCTLVSRNGMELSENRRHIETDYPLEVIQRENYYDGVAFVEYDNGKWFLLNGDSDMSSKDQWRTRTRSVIHDKVFTDWSEYSDTKVTGGGDREVRTRTVYRWRYRTGSDGQ